MTTFFPRYTYNYKLKTSWFPGHMSSGFKDIKDLLRNIDLVIETRDSRVPISSHNIFLEKTFHEDFYKDGILCSLKDPKSIKEIHKIIKMKALELNKTSGMNVIVVGIPNVGKSTLLNSFRYMGISLANTFQKIRKVARTGSQPGITKKVTQKIKIMEKPLVYCMDTPGIMIPFTENPITFLNLALIGSIKDNIIDIVTVADYLLFRLNLIDPKLYLIPFKMNQPTNNIQELLNAISITTGRLNKGGTSNIHAAATFFINKYRSGNMGKFILDDVSEKNK
ncbi:hypothetical protein PCANB_002824 [Pneumocystis canis]|nr:hypothetical protein PCANB_002824 [Pneumocystis canis]